MSNAKDPKAEFADTLRRLAGKEFQRAVCTALVHNVEAFQNLPGADGDGGLDGLSDDRTIGYCCYGTEIETSVAKTKKQKADAVVKKFTSDLRRILEVEGRKHTHKPNEKLEKILKGSTKKIKEIRLCCNWFQDPEIVGRLNTALSKCKEASECRFVRMDCLLVIEGPDELSNRCYVDDRLLFAIGHPGLKALLDRPPAPKAIDAEQQASLDQKFNKISKAKPSRTAHVARLRANALKSWGEHLSLNEALNDAHPDVYARFVELLDSVVTLAYQRSLGATSERAAEVMREMGDDIRDRITASLQGVIPPEHTAKIADQVVGKLIGECPLGWE